MAVLSVTLVWARPAYERWHLEPYVLDLLWKALLAWLVLHIFCLLHAASGSARPMPVASRLARFKTVRIFARVTAWLVTGLAALAGGASAYASSLVPLNDSPGKVYLVYEDNAVVPRWVFALGMLQVARESEQLLGPGQVRLLRISRDNIKRALAEGVFVIIGSHGQAQGIIAEKTWFTPMDLKSGEVGHGLRYVYLTGCDSGAQADAWSLALKPAKVVTHDRLTAVIEHAWWMWNTAPTELRRTVNNRIRRYELSPPEQHEVPQPR